MPTRSAPPAGAMGAVLGAVSSMASQVQATVKPAAALSVASTFTFPLALMVLVLLYILVESRLDARDPKLRAARGAAAEPLIPFEDEVDA